MAFEKGHFRKGVIRDRRISTRDIASELNVSQVTVLNANFRVMKLIYTSPLKILFPIKS